MKSKSREWIFSIAITIGIVIIAVVGFAIGRYTTLKWFSANFETNAQAYYLGNLLDDDDKKAISKAYMNSDSVYRIMDNISWSVPNMPTPFVGNGPLPGIHGTAHINSMQFRSTDELVIPKPDNIYRIFLTGGSTAFGTGAPGNDRTIAAFLSEKLNSELSKSTNLQFEVYTMANPAWASTHERIIIENRLSELEPDLVISFSGNNDVHWGQLGRNILWFSSYPDEYFLDLINKSYELMGKENFPEITKVKDEEIPPVIVAGRLIKNVKLSTYALGLNDVNLIYILQPTITTTQKTLTERELVLLGELDYFRNCYANIDSALLAFNAANFTYINLSTIFNDLTENEEIFVDSYHFGDIGNKIIAEGIYDNIMSELIKIQ